MENTNADFLLLVGVDTGTSVSVMQEGIQSIVDSLNDNPPKIKVEFDIGETSVNRLRSQVEDILKRGGLSGKTASVDTSSLTQTGTEAQKAAEEITRLKSETSALSSVVDRASKRLDTMAGKLKDIRNPKSGETAISETTKQLIDLSAKIKEIDGTNSGLAKQYHGLKSALGGESATGQNATDVELLKNKYLELMNAVELLRAKKTTAAQEEVQQIYTLQGELGSLIAKTHKRITVEQEATAAAKREASEAATAEAQRQSEITAAAAKRPAILKSIIALLGQVEKAERNWTASQKGSTSTNYAKIQKMAEALRQYRIELENVSEDNPAFAEQIRKIDDGVKQLGIDFKDNSNIIQDSGKATKTFSERLGSLAQKFGYWFSITRVMMAAYRAIRQMISASIELDGAMTQLQIVTKDTDETYEKFGDNIAKTAKKIGASITDLLDSTTTYARLGYSLDESSALAEYTAMLQAVGNIDVSAAQDAITSIVKAFDVNTNDIESIMDKLVTTGRDNARQYSDVLKEIGYIG